MSKMFVHYNGTKADFINAGKAAEYVNHIVFIKGGANGTGACVYTHGEYYGNVEEALTALKYFSKVKVGTTEAEAVGPNGTLTFAAADPSSVSLDGESALVESNTAIPYKPLAIESLNLVRPSSATCVSSTTSLDKSTPKLSAYSVESAFSAS